MPALQLLSTRPLAGKTALAVGLGRGFSEAGARVELVRSGSGAAAEQDAATFATCLFASTPGHSVLPGDLQLAPEPDVLTIIELDAGVMPFDGLSAIIAVREAPTDADLALARSLGGRLVGSVAIDVAPGAVEGTARELTNGDMRPLALLPEDRRLAAPCVAELRDILAAEVLYASENEYDVVEDVLIAPVYADPARPHFRRFASKAILAPFNKTDLHLAAIETQAACLVITGGHQPSPYVVNRAQGEGTTVLLAPEETPATLAALSGAWSQSRFRGASKADAVVELLAGRIDYATLLKRL